MGVALRHLVWTVLYAEMSTGAVHVDVAACDVEVRFVCWRGG